MGISTFYQALPEQSILFKRVQTEKAISTLFEALFRCGSGIFFVSELGKEDLDEILDWVVEYEEAFNSRAEVEQCLNELYMELERANTFYPGLVDRGAYLEKCQNVIEERLSRELNREQLGNLDYIKKLLYGDQKFAPQIAGENYDQLLLVPSSLVQESIWVLREIEPETLFEDALERESYLEDFQRWREFYFEAAERGEAVVIGLA